MSDYLAETPIIDLETWCPECGGPPVSERASVAYCMNHMPITRGSVDPVNFGPVSAWIHDAGGEGNQRMCALVHRGEA